MSIQEHYVVSVCDEKNTCLNAVERMVKVDPYNYLKKL